MSGEVSVRVRCGACLSQGRRLSQLGAARASHLLFALGEDVGSELAVCWECRALVDKTLLFGARMRHANDMMITSGFFIHSPDQNNISISTLGCITKIGYDCELYCDIDDDIPNNENCQFIDQDSSQAHCKPLSVVTPYLNLYVKNTTERVIEAQTNISIKREISQSIQKMKIKEESMDSINEEGVTILNESDYRTQADEMAIIKTESGHINKTIFAESDDHSCGYHETLEETVLKEEPIHLLNEQSQTVLNKSKYESNCTTQRVEEPDIIETENGNLNKATFAEVDDHSNSFLETFLKEKPMQTNAEKKKIAVDEPKCKDTFRENAKILKTTFMDNQHENTKSNRNNKTFRVAANKSGFPLLTSLLLNPRKIVETEEVREKVHTDSTRSENTLQKNPQKERKSVNVEKKQFTRASLHNLLSEIGDWPFRKNQFEKVWRVSIGEAEMLAGREADRLNVKYDRSQFKCETCIMGFSSKASLEEHNNSKHSPTVGPCICDICGVRFTTPVGVSMHRSFHYYQYVCEVCGFGHRQHAVASRHYRAEHKPGEIFQCKPCGKGFITVSRLKYHTATTHIARKQGPFCSKTFNLTNSLNKHMKTYDCDECGKRFPARHRLVRHKHLHHKQSPESASCAVCSKQYVCDYCDKRFVTKQCLRRHISCIHMQTRRHRCKLCKKIFITRASFEKHIRKVHQALKPVKDKLCNVCGKGFSNNSLLSKHSLVHTGERPYQCDICGATFNQTATLSTHNKIVHLNMKRTKKGWVMKTQ